MITNWFQCILLSSDKHQCIVRLPSYSWLGHKIYVSSRRILCLSWFCHGLYIKYRQQWAYSIAGSNQKKSVASLICWYAERGQLPTGQYSLKRVWTALLYINDFYYLFILDVFDYLNYINHSISEREWSTCFRNAQWPDDLFPLSSQV